MPHRPNLLFALALCALPIACSPAIDLPTPEELKVKQIVGAPAPQVELSWKLIIRVDGYLVHYRAGSAGPPWDGAGLAIVPWPEGCGDLDAGTAKGSDAFTTIATEAGAADAGSDAAPDNGSHDKGAPDTGIADTGAPDKGAPDQGPSDLNAPDKAATPDSAAVDSAAPAPGVKSPIKLPVEWCLDREDTFKDAGKLPVHTPGTRPRVRLKGLRVGQTYHFAVQAFRRAGTSPASAPVKISIKEKLK